MVAFHQADWQKPWGIVGMITTVFTTKYWNGDGKLGEVLRDVWPILISGVDIWN